MASSITTSIEEKKCITWNDGYSYNSIYIQDITSSATTGYTGYLYFGRLGTFGLICLQIQTYFTAPSAGSINITLGGPPHEELWAFSGCSFVFTMYTSSGSSTTGRGEILPGNSQTIINLRYDYKPTSGMATIRAQTIIPLNLDFVDIES